MIFTYKKWDSFCHSLQRAGFQSVPAREVKAFSGSYLVLKHDVETNVPSAYRIAQIEKEYGHRGSYYVQAYLLENKENVELLRKMLRLEAAPKRMESYDISNTGKSDIVASMVVYSGTRPLKSAYRRFRIKTVEESSTS